LVFVDLGIEPNICNVATMRIYLVLLSLLIFIACKTENTSESEVSIQIKHPFGNAYLKVFENHQLIQESTVKGIYDKWNLGSFQPKTKFTANLTKSVFDTSGWVNFIWYQQSTVVKYDSIFLDIQDTICNSDFQN
jgi:hypothetical protein